MFELAKSLRRKVVVALVAAMTSGCTVHWSSEPRRNYTKALGVVKAIIAEQSRSKARQGKFTDMAGLKESLGTEFATTVERSGYRFKLISNDHSFS